MKKTISIFILISFLSGCSAPRPRPCDDSVASVLFGFIGLSVCGNKQQINPYF